MVTAELAGGLGNQMFQYACGRALSLRLGTDLQLNTTNPDRDPLRHYALDCFPNIQVPRTQRVSGFINEERGTRYDPSVFRMDGADIFLRGYWQSEKYFAEIRDVLLKDFEFPFPRFSKNAINLSHSMLDTNSLSVHVRRGDYVTDPRSIEIMGCLPLEWYQDAFSKPVSFPEDPRFFIFSDDPQWCKERFNERYKTIIEGNKDYEDLWLMSLCKHSIVANSSFSWWGAWLSTYPGIRIAPKKWFATRDSSEVCPESWLRI